MSGPGVRTAGDPRERFLPGAECPPRTSYRKLRGNIKGSLKDYFYS